MPFTSVGGSSELMLCSSDVEYGDAVLTSRRAVMARKRQVQPSSTQEEVATSLFSHVTKLDKSGTHSFQHINCCHAIIYPSVIFFYFSLPW